MKPKIELKPMVYESERTREILAHDVIDGIEFYIVSLGTHPCAYIYVSPRNPISRMSSEFSWSDLSEKIICHGGVTWFDSCLPDNKRYSAGKWLGWDYAHAWDWIGGGNYCLTDSKKWTTEEIFEEVRNVIAQVKRYEG